MVTPAFAAIVLAVGPDVTMVGLVDFGSSFCSGLGQGTL